MSAGTGYTKRAQEVPVTTFVDKPLTCRDCGIEFTFTAGEQEFYETLGLVELLLPGGEGELDAAIAAGQRFVDERGHRYLLEVWCVPGCRYRTLFGSARSHRGRSGSIAANAQSHNRIGLFEIPASIPAVPGSSCHLQEAEEWG